MQTYCSGFSCCRAQASIVLVHGLSGSVAYGIFLDQGSNPHPCIGRQILNHCTTVQVLVCYFYTYDSTCLFVNEICLYFCFLNCSVKFRDEGYASLKKNIWGYLPFSILHVCINLDLYSLGIHGDSDSKESACNAGDLGLNPGLGRSSGEGNGNPFQYSCLENPMDWGAWWATVHGVTRSQTWLSN